MNRGKKSLLSLPCLLFVLISSTAFTYAQEPWMRHTIDDTSTGADGVRLTDVNDDGLLDVATGWEEGGVVRAYINPGPEKSGTPWQAVTVGEAPSVEDAVFVDLDNDGAMDVVSCAEGSTRTVFIHWAPGAPEDYLDTSKWLTESIQATAGAQAWMYCLPIQLDGKHGTDLVVGSKGEGATVSWLQAPEDARDLDGWILHEICPAAWIMSIHDLDLDKDGALDLVISDRKGSNSGIFWLENPGVGDALGRHWNRHLAGGAGKQVMFLTTADLDGDVNQDIVSAVSGQELALLMGLPGLMPAWEESRIAFPDTCGTGKAAAVGNLNHDGSLEIVVTCENSLEKTGVFYLDFDEGSEAWVMHDISGIEGVKYDLVELIDLDNDGDLDVLTCEERTGLGVFWYENPLLDRRDIE